MLAGYVGSTISRDAGYDFLSLGRSLERADMTARLLAAIVSTAGRNREDDWVTTLRACSAHEAYLRTYQRGISSRLALEFLLLDRLFPRSVLHALTVGEEALARLDPTSGRTGGVGDDARRVIGRVRTDLEFLPLDQLLDGLPERLHRIQRGMSQVSEAVAGRYFATSAVQGWTLEVAER